MRNYNKVIHIWCLHLVMLLGVCSIMQNEFAVSAEMAGTAEPIVIKDIKPESLEESMIVPGLKATYYLGFFKRDVGYLQKMVTGEFKSFEGKPITQINHQFERGEVFDSGEKRGVAIRMRGYLHFRQPGEYSMQALSNDGVLLHISDQLALNDPKQHSDQLSNIARITIGTPGWYPLSIDYFQRKGTAAFKLFWKIPGAEEFEVIPKWAYGHTR